MPQPVTRRTALRGATGTLAVAGAGLLAGCSGDLPDLPTGDATRSGTDLEPDERSVQALVARLTTSTALLARTGRSYPLLAPPLAAVLAAERTHLATLRRSARAADLPTPGSGATPTAGASPGAALATRRAAALSAAQQDTRVLRAAYFAAAERAESGSFARLLASMGCSLSQRLPGMSL